MVIEYNCRFGDPETQAVLPLLETDLLEIMEAVTDGRLVDIDIRFSKNHAACVVLASGGYPSVYKTGLAISGLNANGNINEDMVTIYHAGTECKEGVFYTSGGRVLGVTAVSSTLDEVLKKAYKAAEIINFDSLHYRKDIGKY